MIYNPPIDMRLELVQKIAIKKLLKSNLWAYVNY